MKKSSLLSLAAIITALLSFSANVRAQERDAPKVEVGAQFSSLSLTPPGFSGTENPAGFGGRITYNLNDYFAVEAEGNIYPTRVGRQFTSGGAAEQMQFGVKVGKRYDRFGVFAKARPGFVSFGDTIIRFGQRNTPGFLVSDPNFAVPAETTHSFQFSAGIGFRF